MQTELTSEERNWGMAAHLSALIAIAGMPFGHVLGPLVVYLVKGGQSPFVAQHARASLNYQITISLAAIAGIVIGIVALVAFGLIAGVTGDSDSHLHGASATAAVTFVGIWIVIGLVIVAALVFSLVFIIMGTVAASEGRPFHYPFSIPFVR